MSEITKRQSMLFIQQLRTAFSVSDESIDFLKDTASVVKYLKSKTSSINTLKTYFSRIVAFLRDKPSFEKETEIYRVLMTTYRDDYNKSRETQTLTKTEEEKMLTKAEILKVRKVLKSKAVDLLSFQKYLIVCLYTYLPPQRLDYADMCFTDRPNKNVCLPTKVIFREYKTASTFGDRTLKLPKVLQQIILEYREKYNKTDCLLIKQDGTPMTPAGLGQMISSIFKAETGKGCTVNILRHRFITDMREGELSLLEKQKLADSMGHSLSTSELYRRV